LSFFLNSKIVDYINSWLSTREGDVDPFVIIQKQPAYLGTTVYGKGFFLSEYEKKMLVSINYNHSNFIKPFLNGDDVLNNPESRFSRYVLYMQEIDIDYLESSYPQLYEFAYSRIYNDRQKSTSKRRREKWWLYTSPAEELYNSINKLDNVIVTCFTSKHPVFVLLDKNQIFSNAVIVICSDTIFRFGVLQSNIHISWIQEYGSTLETRQRYAVSDCYDTFPFPKSNPDLENNSNVYLNLRKEIQNELNIGLTDLYNNMHDNSINNEKFTSLRRSQIALDYSVVNAYDWSDVPLRHNFYEIDYLPENDRIRFTIHPDARREVLKRLLELNHQIHEEEVKAGLWEKKGSSKMKSKKYLSSSSESGSAQEPEERYGGLFGVNE